MFINTYTKPIGKRLLRLAALACALSLPVATANAAEAGAAMKKARVELGASAAFDRAGQVWAAGKDGGHVVVRKSTDAGQSWSPPSRVNAIPEAIAADGEGLPKIAFGPNDEIYVSWTRPLSKPYSGEIRFARSLDGGASFDAPLTVHADRQEITHRFDALSIASDGKIFVAWIDKRDLLAAKAASRDYRGAAVYYAVSADQGATFRGDYRIADHTCECCRIAVSAQPDGDVIALWRHVFEPNIRDHALARLHADGRAEPLQRATFDNWRTDACPHHGPALTTDGNGDMHAVWFTQGETPGVFYGRLASDRVEGRRKLGGARAAHADIAAQGNALLVAWKEFDGERTLLHGEYSADGGKHWTARELAGTAAASDQPRVLARDGRLAVFWNTQDEGMRVFDMAAGTTR